jgi:hypothetical protein
LKILRHLTALAIAVLALSWQTAQGATTLLPPGENCFSALQPTSGGPGGTGTGFVGLLGAITPGTGGTTGTYGGVALTGGSGTGATANITVAGGVVTQVAVLNPGVQYVVGDVLSATSSTIGNASGFSVPVSSISINSSLAGGKIYFYVPNTNTFKQTWKDSGQVTLNQNPVPLDANGCAIIFGVGTYRQVLQDSLSNTIWDQLTTDTSAYNSTFWAGVAAGTPNVITLTDVGFNGTDGSVLNFTALATNTGATTINPSGYGAIPVLQDTTAGPVALVPGQIIQGNVISVVYRAQDNSFHLLNPPIQTAGGNSAPLCGASGLSITNGTSPNSIIAATANAAVTVSSSGIVIHRSNISLANINITTGISTSTANGMDGEAPGISAWLDVWLIDNGAASAGLVSLASGNGLTPTLPSGYIYICRIGAMFVDGSGNLLPTLQKGNNGQFVSAGTTATQPRIIANGTVGTFSATSPTLASTSITSCVPPTATQIKISLSTYWKSGTVGVGFVAPSTAWGGTNNGPNGSNGVVYPLYVDDGSFNGSISDWMILESTSTIGIAGVNAGFAVACMGWKDSVNAN